MRQFTLGRTGIKVSELCFGALPMGPLQKNLSPDQGAEIIYEALCSGINFIDTAELYQTYEPISRALAKKPPRPVIASKSMATDYDGMMNAVEESLSVINLDYIDIFHIHAARVAAEENVLKQREGAWQALLECREKGLVKALGISTHSVPAVKLAAQTEEVDIIFPLINIKGTGILHGSVTEMEQAIKLSLDNNKGVYLMKALAGGSLVCDFDTALSYIRDKFSLPIAMGMVSSTEVKFNLAYFNAAEGEKPELGEQEMTEKCFQIVDFLCKDCGQCIETCPNFAIGRKSEENKPEINPDICLRCGYCVGFCPQFAIRMT